MKYDLTYLKAFVSEALIGKIDPNVRAIFAIYGINEIVIEYFHESELTNSNKINLEKFISSLRVYFSTEYEIEYITKRLDTPNVLPVMNECIYMRQNEQLICSKFDASYLKLAIIKSLLGLVSRTLRAVSASIGGGKIFLNCFFDDTISADQNEDMKSLANRVKQWFSPDYSLHLNIQHLDFPISIPQQGELAYLRKES